MRGISFSNLVFCRWRSFFFSRCSWQLDFHGQTLGREPSTVALSMNLRSYLSRLFSVISRRGNYFPRVCCARGLSERYSVLKLCDVEALKLIVFLFVARVSSISVKRGRFNILGLSATSINGTTFVQRRETIARILLGGYDFGAK